jgi:acylphosphatase
VLEIGTGSGYQTVLLAHLVAQVFSIERIAPLLEQAQKYIQQSGGRTVSLLRGDGPVGWRAHAPYDAILVSAASPKVPQPLVEQLGEGGKLVIPLGGLDEQDLVMFTRKGQALVRESILPVRFVPLLGTHGWREEGGGGGRGEGRGPWMSELHVRITGMVQGVGFRWFVRERARRLGLTGWVRNLPDGSVEVAAAGDEKQLELLRAELQRGPRGAAVEQLQGVKGPLVEPLSEPFGIIR